MKVLLYLGLAGILLGCAQSQFEAPAAQSKELVLEGDWHLDLDSSKVRAMVYRAGTLSRFGHDHVVRLNPSQGVLSDESTLEKASASLSFAVADIVIDAQADRDWAGHFSSAKAISEKDKAGTLKNLLSAALLNAEVYSQIQLKVSGIQRFGDQYLADVEFIVLGESHHHKLPFTMQRNSERIDIAGSVVLLHEQLGLKPFSAFGGAVKVANPIALHFEFVFTRGKTQGDHASSAR